MEYVGVPFTMDALKSKQLFDLLIYFIIGLQGWIDFLELSNTFYVVPRAHNDRGES